MPVLRYCLFAAVALGALPGRALAHDLWLERQGDGLILQFGHRGEKALPLDRAKIKTLKCLPKAGPPADLLTSATSTASRLTLSASCAAASAFLYGGFYSLTPDGEKNAPKSQVPDAVKAWESKQYAKWVDPGSPLAKSPLGDEFEIVPVTDLSKAKQGDKATFRILLDGKPVAGAVLAIDHKPLGETDSAGEVRVKLRASDLECVSATLRRPVKTADADQQVWEASLSFEVAK